MCGGPAGKCDVEATGDEEAVVTRLEHTGGKPVLVVVVAVAVDMLVLQLAAACKALARLLIRCEVLAGVPAAFCSLTPLLLLVTDRDVAGHLLLCNEGLLGRLDTCELLLLPVGTPATLW